MRPGTLLLAFLLSISACRTQPPRFLSPADHGEQRWRHYFEERAYPFGTIPADARRRALAEATRRQPEIGTDGAATEAATPKWRSLGPTPVQTAFSWGAASGRIKALAISPANPTLILAGSSSGGVWRSTDAGATFVPVSDSHVDLSIGAIAFAPSDPNIVYAAMGSDFLGTGVLRSDDAGATWRHVSGPTFSQRGVSLRAVVDASNPNRLWVAQTLRQGAGSTDVATGVLRSEDGGVTWKNVLGGIITDLLLVPGTNDTLLTSLSVNPGKMKPGVYRSTDGGANWTLIRPAGFFFPMAGEFVLAVPPSMPNRYYAYGSTDTLTHRHVMNVSDDAGATWRSYTNKFLPDQPFYLGVDPANPDTLFLGLRDAYRSTDGGATWTNLSKSLDEKGRFEPLRSTTHIDQHSFAAVPGALYFGNDGGIFKSTDGGNTLTSLSRTLSVIQAYGVAAHPTDPATLYLGTQDNGLERRTADGTWREVVTGDFGFFAFDPNNPSRVISNYVEGQLILLNERNESSNLTYNSSFGEIDNIPRIAFIAPFEQARTRGTLYFGTYRVYFSDDFGRTWNLRSQDDLTTGNNDRLRAIGISDGDPLAIYTGSRDGRVMVSRDGGFSWRDATAGLPQRTVKAFALDPRDSSIAHIALSGYGSDHVYVTRDGGTTWTAASEGLPDVPVNALLIDPADPEVLYAGTDIGVFRRERGGAWTLFNRGMPHVMINDFAVTADQRIIAATYGRGAYELVQSQGTSKRRSVR